MAFFLWFDENKYRPLAYLYAAGKILSICAVASAVFSSLREFLAVFLIFDTKKILVNSILPCLTLLDILTLAPAILSLKSAIRPEA
jgi:hypothetical protein